MTVKELIEKLQQFDQDNDVCFYVEERDCERLVGSVKEEKVVVRFVEDKDGRLTIPVEETCIMLNE